MTDTYAPGTYVKGDDERVAKSASAAVALVFDGFKLKEADVAADEPKVVVDENKTETPITPAPKPSELVRPRKPEDNQS